METTVIYSDGDTLKTNGTLRNWLGDQKKFVAIIEGDSLIIKKSHSLLDFSSEPDEDFMSMEQINEEVHKVREGRAAQHLRDVNPFKENWKEPNAQFR